MTFEEANYCMTNSIPVLVSPEYLDAHFPELPELKEHTCTIIAVRGEEADVATFDGCSLESVALCMLDKEKILFKTVIQVEILSEYMYSDLKTLADIHYDITDGECSGLISTISINEVLTGEEAVKAVQQHGSGMDFFGMDEDEDEI